jgi:hypothetical protein
VGGYIIHNILSYMRGTTLLWIEWRDSSLTDIVARGFFMADPKMDQRKTLT